MDASLALRRQFARNFANNSVRIVLGTTSLASKRVGKGLCNPPKQKPTRRRDGMKRACVNSLARVNARVDDGFPITEYVRVCVRSSVNYRTTKRSVDKSRG